MGHNPYPNLERARRRIQARGVIRENRQRVAPNAGCTLVLPRVVKAPRLDFTFTPPSADAVVSVAASLRSMERHVREARA